MKKRGVGIAAGLYPSGLVGGGDPSQAIVKVKPDGSVDLIVGSTDLGQGCKTILVQMVAEELGVRYDQVNLINADTDAGPLCMGTFASRVTFVAGNAVVAAAREAKAMLFELAAKELEASPEDLAAADGKIFVIRYDGADSLCGDTDVRAPNNSVAISDIAATSPLIVGRGTYMPAQAVPDPETGQWNAFHTLAWGAVLAEVDVDTGTGEVDLLRLVCVFDAGKAINPQLVVGQIEGGAVMSQGQAVMEKWQPYYPSLYWQPTTLRDYMIPTAADIPAIHSVIYECPSADGPYGAKGIGEITANVPTPAIASAICNAIGIWIDEIPITPEKILRALDENTTM